LETFNSKFPDRETFKPQLENLFRLIESCAFPNAHRVWNQTELFNLLVEMHATAYKDQIALDPGVVCGRLHTFYDAVDAMNEALPSREVSQSEEAPTGHDSDVFRYLKAATSRASSDKYTRVTRGEVIRRVITGAWPDVQNAGTPEAAIT
jgi:hypothetical protein